MGEKGVWDLLDVLKRHLMLCGTWMRGRNGRSRGPSQGAASPQQEAEGTWSRLAAVEVQGPG